MEDDSAGIGIFYYPLIIILLTSPDTIKVKNMEIQYFNKNLDLATSIPNSVTSGMMGAQKIKGLKSTVIRMDNREDNLLHEKIPSKRGRGEGA